MVEGALTGDTPAARRRLREPPRLRSASRAVRARLRGERGTAVVEFSLVAIPLLLIVFGILDFGRALNYYNDLTQIAGQGARAASVNQNVDGTTANNTFQHQLACEADSGELRNGINVYLVTAPSHTASSPVGQPVTVKATFQFQFIPLLHQATLTLSASQTERWESGNPPPSGFDAANNVTGGAGSCP